MRYLVGGEGGGRSGVPPVMRTHSLSTLWDPLIASASASELATGTGGGKVTMKSDFIVAVYT